MDNQIETSIPSRYTHLMEQETYDILLKMSLACLRQHFEVDKVEDGVIYAKTSKSGYVQCALDNLIRQCTQLEQDEWFDNIHAHFEKVISHASRPEIGDFETAKSKLAIRIYPNNYVSSSDFRNRLVHRIDLEGTISILVLDLEDKFISLTYDDIAEWDTTPYKLFGLAQKNTNQQQVEVTKMSLGNLFDLYAFFSSDYAASYVLDLAQNADFAIGKFGALVAMPAKGAVMTHPIDGPEVMIVLQSISPLINKFFKEEVGNISNDFYWFYEGKFKMFPNTIKDNYQSIDFPKDLLALFETAGLMLEEKENQAEDSVTDQDDNEEENNPDFEPPFLN